MFGSPKPTFGQAAGTFGSFNTSNAASPFGQNTFGKPAGTGFGTTAPTFGAPTTGSTLFGSPAPATGGIFGQPANQTGFGFTQNTSGGGLFGANQSNTSLFGQTTPATQTFGAKPAGFGSFGTTSTGPVGGIFGANNQIGTGLFGQTATPAPQNTGLFGSPAGGFGATGQTGTYIKFAPVSGTDVIVKNGQGQSINTQHHCITCMKEYENKSLEELRYEDYLANRKVPGQTSMFGSTPGNVGGAFGQPSTSRSFFGQPAEDKPGGTFGQAAPSAFGQSSMFGKPATSGFGAQPPTSNTFAFGTNTTNQTPMFGAAKPFGAAAAPVFSTPTQGNTFRPAQQPTFSSFGNMQQPGGIFGAKPPENNTFGMPQTSTAGSFGFGQAPAQNTGDIFGAKPATTFGTAAPVFGSTAPFGGTANPGGAAGSIFPSFGAKPAETGVPTFGNFNATSNTNPGLGGGINLGGSMFGAKPQGMGLFGAPAGTGGAGIFGNAGNTQLGSNMGALGGGSTLGGTGMGTFGAGGLGTGSTWGGLNMNSNLNMGAGTLGANPNPGTLGGIGGNNMGGGVHDRLITLTRAYPYGYSALLKDISPTSDKADDSLKPTNPAAQRAVLESDKYRVSTGNTRLRVKPLHANSKKSLFDGLEEDDPSIQKLILKPNVKRLVLRPKPANLDTSPSTEQAQNESTNQNISDLGNVSASANIPIASPQHECDDSVNAQNSSATNIQKRIGLTSPRGSILKNSSNTPSVSAENSNIEDTPENRRSSWLATKQFRPRTSDSNESAPLDNTVEQFLNVRNPSTQQESERQAPNPRMYPDLSVYYEFANPMGHGDGRGLLDIEDKENIENPSSNDGEDSPVESQSGTPHPTGIKLTRPGYYTIPPMETLMKDFMKSDGKCIVPQFTIGRRGYGNVFFDCEMDVTNLDIDQLVHILNKEIIIYPNDAIKPPIGEGLNRPAQVTLDYVHPIDKTLKTPITSPEKLAKMDYEGKLRRVCHKHGTRFIEYRPQTGSWVFKVPHFSKYGLTNSDEEDEGQADSQQKPPSQQPLNLPPQPAQRGLGGFLLAGHFPTEIQSGINPLIEHNNQTMDSVAVDTPFISRLNGVTKGLTMDTSEENSMDSAALYPEAGHASFYGSKDATSPTSQLARLENRSSHTLQLMKASFFNAVDEDMDDVASVTDQMVPQLSIPRGNASIIADVPCSVSISTRHSKPEAPLYSGLSIKQLVVKPKSVVLQYHKRVLSYKNTITGRFGNECYADMAMGFARLMRVGWGPSLNLTALTTANVVNDKTQGGDLLVLNSLMRGRQADDISQQMVMRLQIAGGGPPSKDNKFKDSIEKLLNISLQYSEIGEGSENSCPQISPSNQQISAAQEYLEEAIRLEGVCGNVNFGVNPSYWKDVWSLCIALWGEHGDEESDPNIPNGSRLLGQHTALSEWLQSVSNSHSDESSVFTSLASRNIYEACRLAQKQGDHFLSIMISQIGGEMRVRNLAARQLGLWRETCADRVIDSVRLIIYALLAGRSRILVSGSESEEPTTLHVCNGLDWIRSFGLHFWYICEPVATIGDAIRAYEKSFYEESQLRKSGNNRIEENDSDKMNESGEEFEFDLTTAETDDILYGRVAFPSPPYEINMDDNEKSMKRVLDLRYQLMALRASRWHSIDSLLNPASHTPDLLDYRLSWLIQQFLEGIGYSHWSARGLFNILTGFAAQLEAHGMWIWAVFILQHIKDTDVRNHMVKNLIMSHANDNSKDTSELLNKFGIPRKWVYESLWLKNKYIGNRENEAQYLTLAGQFGEAHKVIINEIAPSTILNEKTNDLRKLLLPLSSVGYLEKIPQWSTGGHLLLDFFDICDEVNNLQEGDCENLAYKCEALRIRLANACTAVNLFPTPTLKHTVVRCEIGARLASIGCAIAGLGSTLNKTNITPLLNLLHRMDLPSDYVRNLLDKVSDSVSEDSEPNLYTEISSSSEENDVEIMTN